MQLAGIFSRFAGQEIGVVGFSSGDLRTLELNIDFYVRTHPQKSSYWRLTRPILCCFKSGQDGTLHMWISRGLVGRTPEY